MNNVSAKKNDKWVLKNFVSINAYIDETLKIISALCVIKDNKPVEKYENIGFLYDLFDYQILNGEKIISLYSDAEIEEFIKGGKKEVSKIIEKLKNKKVNDFLSFNNTFDEIGDYGDLSDSDLQDRINKMSKDTKEVKDLKKENVIAEKKVVKKRKPKLKGKV